MVDHEPRNWPLFSQNRTHCIPILYQRCSPSQSPLHSPTQHRSFPASKNPQLNPLLDCQKLCRKGRQLILCLLALRFNSRNIFSFSRLSLCWNKFSVYTAIILPNKFSLAILAPLFYYCFNGLQLLILSRRQKILNELFFGMRQYALFLMYYIIGFYVAIACIIMRTFTNNLLT